MEKTKNSIRGIIAGGINRVVGIVMPFVLRTVMINALGKEYLGLNSLFASILSVLSLAELGFGSAMVYSMYNPIATKDNAKLCELLNLYRKIYRIIGCVIFCVGICLIPFLDTLTSGECPQDVNLYILYIICLINTTITYFFGGYRSSVLIAHQRRDCVDIVNTINYVLFYPLQIVLLLITKNYYIYTLIIPVMSITSNLMNAYAAKKMYPNIFPEGKIRYEEKQAIYKNVGALFVQRIGTTISKSLDSIIISSFLGLAQLAIYSNYYYIFSSVESIAVIVFNSMTAGIGNALITKSLHENKYLFKKLLMLTGWGAGWCSICLLCLYQPFIELWAGETYLLNISSVICFSIYFYINLWRRNVQMFKDAYGLWNQDKFKPLIGGFINLVCNVVLVKYWGINGVIVSTIVSYVLIEMPWETIVLFRSYFKSGLKEYTYSSIKQMVITCIIAGITYSICTLVGKSGWFVLIIRTAICVVIPNTIFLLLNHRKEEFKSMCQMVKHALYKAKL